MKNIDIKTLQKELFELEKKGIKEIQINGTLLCKEEGNKIIISNLKQM